MIGRSDTMVTLGLVPVVEVVIVSWSGADKAAALGYDMPESRTVLPPFGEITSRRPPTYSATI